MRKIGYTVKTDTQEESLYLSVVEGCQAVVEVQDKQENYLQFEQFLKEYAEDQLVVVDFESIGLQLSQLAPLFEQIKKQQITLHFVKKPVPCDDQYLSILHELAESEKKVVSRRTLKGLRVAHANGIVSGRPKIDQATVDKIQYLYAYQKKNIRQISLEVGVSLGTVHKYIHQINTELS